MARHKKERPAPESPDTPWRLFVAVPLPDGVRAQLAACIDLLKKTDLPVRWVDAEHGHLTLHFIGETEPEVAELLRMALAAPISPHEPFELRTAETGAFPKLQRPRVLWLGLWGPAHRLESLYNDIGDFLDDFGIEIDDVEFRPHITMGRVRNTRGLRVSELPEKIRASLALLEKEGIAGKEFTIPFPINEVQLIRSHLSTAGPRYEILASYALLGTDLQ